MLLNYVLPLQNCIFYTQTKKRLCCNVSFSNRGPFEKRSAYRKPTILRFSPRQSLLSHLYVMFFGRQSGVTVLLSRPDLVLFKRSVNIHLQK